MAGWSPKGVQSTTRQGNFVKPDIKVLLFGSTGLYVKVSGLCKCCKGWVKNIATAKTGNGSCITILVMEILCRAYSLCDLICCKVD